MIVRWHASYRSLACYLLSHLQRTDFTRYPPKRRPCFASPSALTFMTPFSVIPLKRSLPACTHCLMLFVCLYSVLILTPYVYALRLTDCLCMMTCAPGIPSLPSIQITRDLPTATFIKIFYLLLDPINLPAVQSEARSFIMITPSWTFHRSIHTSCFRGVQNYFLFFMTCNNSFQYACMICRIYVDFA